MGKPRRIHHRVHQEPQQELPPPQLSFVSGPECAAQLVILQVPLQAAGDGSHGPLDEAGRGAEKRLHLLEAGSMAETLPARPHMRLPYGAL